MAAYSMDVSHEDRRKGGEYITQLRHGVGLKAKEIADALGVTKVTISAWENGKAPVRPYYIFALADLLQVNREEFAKKTLRYRDPVMYTAIFGDGGDKELVKVVEGLKANAEDSLKHRKEIMSS